MPNYQEIHYLGRVIDREKQAPISGAKISIHLSGSSRVVYSDLEGIYNFEVPFGDHSVREGEITIEAKGYKTYHSFIRLLPDDTDIGDIRLIDSHDQEAESSENLITIIATIVIVLALIVAALTLPTPQETPPPETPDTRINLQKQFHLSSKLVFDFLHSSVFSKKHAYEIASLFEE